MLFSFFTYFAKWFAMPQFLQFFSTSGTILSMNRWPPTATIRTNFRFYEIVCHRPRSIPRAVYVVNECRRDFVCILVKSSSWLLRLILNAISLFIAFSKSFLAYLVSFNNTLWISTSCIFAIKTSRMMDSSWLPRLQFKDSSRRQP